MGDPAFGQARTDTRTAGPARRSRPAPGQASAAQASAARVGAARGGRPDSGSPVSFGPGFGRDFSRVPVHVDDGGPSREGVPLASAGPPRRWTQAFGTDLSAVRLHPQSARAGGRVHAVTEGDHVYFGAGRFAPGTERGDRLIAHELAHVAQQRRPGRASPELAAELDADAAADAVVRGGTPRIAARVAAGPPHAFESWEHRQLGDAYGGKDRRIRLPNGAELTYGEIVALSGDFYRSPEALLRAPRSEIEDIRRVMATELGEATASPDHRPSQSDSDANNVAYELATTGHSRTVGPAATLAGDTDTPSGPHGVVHEGEHVESGAPGAEASYLDLAESNPAHFSPENIADNWVPKHQLALDLARQAWQSRHPGATAAPITPGRHAGPGAAGAAASAAGAAAHPATAAAAAAVATDRPDPAAAATPAGLASAETTAPKEEQAEAQAWLASAFADHYLTDAFAAGHLVSGSKGRTMSQAFFTTNQRVIERACFQCAMAEGTDPGQAAEIVEAFSLILKSRAPSLLLKTVHDYYNRTGIQVRNVLGQAWRTYGDSRLGGSPETMTMAQLASKASRDAVQDVLATGGTTRAQAALDYVPDMAGLAGGTFVPIATFAIDKSVWNPVLARSLSPVPAVNDLYRMVKGNIGPMIGMYAKKGIRWAGKAARWVGALPGRAAGAVKSAARAARRWVGDRIDEVESIPGRVEQAIKRLYGLP
jgi:hypothetical protein